MRNLLLSILLALTITSCTFTVTPNLQQRTVLLEWPLVVASVTPTPSMTPAATLTGTPTPTLPATVDASPTPEVNVTVIAGTPIVWPTNEPLPALLPVVGSLNVRSGAGTNRGIVGALGRTDCVEFDPRVVVQANGYSWVQVHVARFGEGTWVAAKVVGGNHLARFYAGQPCVFEVNYPLP